MFLVSSAFSALEAAQVIGDDYNKIISNTKNTNAYKVKTAECSKQLKGFQIINVI